MSDFPIEKADLINIVSLCQERRYAEEIEELQKYANDTTWLVEGLKTDIKKGIETSETEIQERKNKYGTNEKLLKEPPGFFQLFCEAL